MKAMFTILALLIGLVIASPASACENEMIGVTAAQVGLQTVVSWTYQNECGTKCFFSVETKCCDAGTWSLLTANCPGSTYSFVPANDCDAGRMYRVTMVVGCNSWVCSAESICY